MLTGGDPPGTSEAIVVQRLHVQLDSPEPEVCVCCALVRGRIEPPKTRRGRREVRLPDSLAADIAEGRSLFDLIAVSNELEESLGVDVDVVTEA